jgi:hypothetical protein
MAEISRYRTLLAGIASGPLRGFWGSRLVFAIGLLFDEIAEGASLALKASWVKDSQFAPDGTLPASNELRLPRYPGESFGKHVTRMQGVWETYARAGDEDVLLEQLTSSLSEAGFTNPEIFYSSDPLNRSRFRVFYRPGHHPVTNDGSHYGAFTWGDGSTYGPGGITATQIGTFRAIIAQWKPLVWVCDEVLFQISGWSYGDGTHWGDVGLVWGGETASIGV